MDALRKSEPMPKWETTTDRRSDREVVVTRTFNGPARNVFDAWTKPELIMMSVWPSAWAFAARSVPMMPVAPARLSITTG